jgi:hypothetical protein
LRILPTVEEETVKPSFLRRIPPGVFEPVPQALRSIGASGSFWGFSIYPSGFWRFLGLFFFHRKEALGYSIFRR